MKTALVTWQGQMTFNAEMDGQHVTMSTVGESGDNRGPSPSSLLLAALGGCTAMDVVLVLQKKRQPLTGLVVRVEGEQADEDPHRYTRVTVTYEVHGQGVDRAAVERAVALSDEKYCSVSATLKQPTEVCNRVVLVESTAAED